MSGNNGRNGNNVAGKKAMPVGKPFVKGDPRCWRKGRPKNFDHFRALALAICAEPITVNGKKMCRAEALLREWMASPEPSLQKAFAEYGFGKVPDKIETTGLENKTSIVLHFAHEKAPREAPRVSLVTNHDSQ